MTENESWEKKNFTAEEYTPEIKRHKAVPREMKLQHCENCGANMLLPDGTCMQCGIGPKIG